MKRQALIFGLLLILPLLHSAPAQAQATRTWVSGVGDDVNPCSRTAPCKTFAGAISKTAAGGEISVLDPGGYGAVTITKSITIDGGTGEGWASVLHSGTSGFIVNTTAATDKVILRNLSINGGPPASLGPSGIRFLAGASLTVENVHIFNFSTAGIDINKTAAGNVFLKNVKITHGPVGIRSTTTVGTIVGSFDDVHIDGMSSHGLQAISKSLLVIRNMISARHIGDGIRSEAATVNLLIENSTVQNNDVGINAVAGTVRIHNVSMLHNNTNLTTNVMSSGQNRSAGNTVTNAPAAAGYTIH
jgi:hypothetical protein